MNLFNRSVLVLICLILIVAAVGIIVLTWTIPNRSINALHDAVDWIDANDGDLEKALLTLICASVGMIAMIVVLFELLPRSGQTVTVTDLSRGAATLPTAAIGQRIEEAVCQVPNVVEVRANVKARKKGVTVLLDLQVDPEANIATVTDEACAVAQEVLTDRVHVDLLQPPTARLHYRELRLRGRSSNGNGARRNERTAPPPATARDEAPQRFPVAVAAPVDAPDSAEAEAVAEDAGPASDTTAVNEVEETKA